MKAGGGDDDYDVEEEWEDEDGDDDDDDDEGLGGGGFKGGGGGARGTSSVFAPAEYFDLSEAIDLGKMLHEEGDEPDEEELEDPLYQADLLSEIAQVMTLILLFTRMHT